MLIEFFGRNFGSFRDEFRLSMLAADIDPGNDRGIVEVPLEGEDEPLRLLRCAAIYGANASGKSTVLQAAGALESLLRSSAETESDRPIAWYSPFLLDRTSFTQPVMLGIRAIIDRRVYEYVIEFDSASFVIESLTELRPNNEIILIERRGNEVHGAWSSDEQFKLLSQSFRSNALLLSLADRLAPKLAGGIAVSLRRMLRRRDLSSHQDWVSFPDREAARRASKDEGFGARLLDWLRHADLGVVGYGIETESQEDVFDRVRLESIWAYDDPFNPESKLSLLHSGADEPVKLGFSSESRGTQRLVELAPYIYDLTQGAENRAYFIDEIGASIHPQLLTAVIREFNCETKPESVKGQLIFATHETALLDAEAKDAILRRDQVYFTEKDAAGASRLYSVAEFKERNNLNLRRRYLQGRYGAVPALGRLGD